MTKSNLWTQLQTRWAILSHYQRFEALVALVLTLVIVSQRQSRTVI